MKFPSAINTYPWHTVTPFTGVWIEIDLDECHRGEQVVTPFTGVWIEISPAAPDLPQHPAVTPFTGVWIEMTSSSSIR